MTLFFDRTSTSCYVFRLGIAPSPESVTVGTSMSGLGKSLNVSQAQYGTSQSAPPPICTPSTAPRPATIIAEIRVQLAMEVQRHWKKFNFCNFSNPYSEISALRSAYSMFVFWRLSRPEVGSCRMFFTLKSRRFFSPVWDFMCYVSFMPLLRQIFGSSLPSSPWS